MPPPSFADSDKISVLNWFFSANFRIILVTSSANRAASSPPTPARISIMAGRSSFGSVGISAVFRVSSAFGRFVLASSNSVLAISIISGSFSVFSISSASFFCLFKFKNILAVLAFSSSVLRFWLSFVNFSMLL